MCKKLTFTVSGKYEYAFFMDVRPTGTAGDVVNTNDCVTRPLNPRKYEGKEDWAVLNGNVITIEPGNYFVKATAPPYSTGKHRLRFWNVTEGKTAILGFNSYCLAPPRGTQSHAALSGLLEVKGTAKEFMLEHITQEDAGGAHETLGVVMANNHGDPNGPEAYGSIEIIKFVL